MKKVKLGFIALFLCCVSVLLPYSANAAYAYSWSVGDEILHKGSSNKSGTASWVEDDSFTGGVLVLENYDGGQLHIGCNGTGLGHIFAIKLVGNNKVTVKDGIGILANVPIVFIGDGTLEITAAIPIGSGSIFINDNEAKEIQNWKFAGDTTVTIEPSKNVSECNCPNVSENDNTQSVSSDTNESDSTEVKDSTSKDNNDSKKEESRETKSNNILSNNMVVNIIVLLYFIFSLIAIIILVVKLKSNKKKVVSKNND